MSEIQQFSQDLSGVIAAVHTLEFSRELVRTLRHQVLLDEATVITYIGSKLPTLEYHGREDDTTRSTIDVFINGAFLLDPCYLAATREGKQGFYQLLDLVHGDFTQGEYYRNYFRDSGVRDECGYLIHLDNESFINIALSRASSETYSSKDVEVLAAMEPLVSELALLHWQDMDTESDSEGMLRSQLECALKDFGSSVLTARECESIGLLLHGYSTRTISERLNIAVKSVKLHRKNAYAKLGINTQAELFYMFIDSLKSMDHYVEGDPLSHYLSVAK